MSPRNELRPEPKAAATPGAGEPGDAGGFVHRPVMLEEVIDLFRPVPEGVVLDATAGGGGHARGLLRAAPQLRVVGLDRDGEAVAAARSALD
ncbi:MAG: 16S rRNA (cytosine(1402)-N(4))-methyltransferase, partial [Acidimicrobiales bacterium]